MLGDNAVRGKDYCVQPDATVSPTLAPSDPTPINITCGVEVENVYDNGGDKSVLPMGCCQGMWPSYVLTHVAVTSLLTLVQATVILTNSVPGT